MSCVPMARRQFSYGLVPDPPRFLKEGVSRNLQSSGFSKSARYILVIGSFISGMGGLVVGQPIVSEDWRPSNGVPEERSSTIPR